MAIGKLFCELGVYVNATELRAIIPTYAHYLRAAGYQKPLSRKANPVGRDQHHSFETRLTPNLYTATSSRVPNWARQAIMIRYLPVSHDS